MKLTNEFLVAVPLEQAWETLLDIELVAGFLPGATIESKDDDAYSGSMRVKVGPMVVNYKGTARLVLADEQEHVAEIAIEAKETRGQGTASAVIRNRLQAEDGRTRVIAETNLNITGRPAQFGRGIMQDVAGRMLDDFAQRLEAHLVGGEGDPVAEPDAAPPSPSVAAAQEALDLGGVLSRTPAVRRAVSAVVALALFIVAIRLIRR